MRKLTMLISSATLAIPVAAVLSTPGIAATPDEIIVSVRRKDENLQEIPLAVSTLDSTTIDRYGIDNVGDVSKYTAGLEFDEGYGAQDTRIVIRGLSPTRGRANVAFLVDGIDFTGEAVSTAGGGVLVNQNLLDVERVEIVKGPQSALYGRSAFAGAIQYITKKPNMEETEGDVDLEYSSGDGDQRTVRFGASYGGPVTESIGLRVNGIVYDETGNFKNTVTNQRVGGSEGYGLALSGLWDASEAVSVSGRIGYSNDEYEPQAQARVGANTLIDIDQSRAVTMGQTSTLIRTSGLAAALANSGGFYPGCDPAAGPTGTNADGTVTSCLGTPKVLVTGQMPDGDQLRIVQSEDPRTGRNYRGTEIDTLTSTFAVKWDTGAGEVSSYTGYANVKTDQLFDGQRDVLLAGMHGSLDGTYDFTLADCSPLINCSPTVQEVGFQNSTRLFSQEFRYSSELDGPVNYTVGALFWKERVSQNQTGASITPAVFRSEPAFFPGPPSDKPVESLPPGNTIVTQVFSPSETLTRRNTESKSIYGLLDIDLSDRVKLTLEGRYVDEDLSVSGDICDTVATPVLTGQANQTVAGEEECNMLFRGNSSVAASTSDGTLPPGTFTKAVFLQETAKFSGSFFAPKATLEWARTDDHLLYASLAKGVKPGGISTITAGAFFDSQANTFAKEELVAFEIGSKATLADGAVTLNSALFYQDYTDKQVGVSRFDPVIQSDVGSIENAGEAEIWGLEVEAVWDISDRWMLAGAYTHVDAEYTEFVVESASANNIARSLAAGGTGCHSLIDNDPAPLDGQSDNCVIILTGNDVEDIPENTFVGSLRYSAPFSGLSNAEWFADTSLIFTDDRFIDEWNTKSLDSYWLMDLRVGLIKDNYEVTFFVDNVLDDDTAKSAVDFGSIIDTTRQGQFPPAPTDGVVVSLPDPRVVGVRFNMGFGG